MLEGLKRWMERRTARKRMEDARRLSVRLSRIDPAGSAVMGRIAGYYENELLCMDIRNRSITGRRDA